MIVEKFLQWSRHACAGDRAKAANALGRAYVQSTMSAEESRAAEAAMVFLLDDPSPVVRLGLAQAIAFSPNIPRAVILGLVGDQLEIAGLVTSCSPVLRDPDLVDMVADSRPAMQLAIAMRRRLSSSVCAALAEVGCSLAVCELLDNSDASVAGVSLRRISERFGDEAPVRARLLERADLPCDVRHSLILKVGDALAGSAFISSVVGSKRVEAVTESACMQATFTMTGNIAESEITALAEHLRIRGILSPAFLMHVLCTGKVEFFAAAIASISGTGRKRVRSILVEGRRTSIIALYQSCGIGRPISEVFVHATILWREASRREVDPDASFVTERLLSDMAAKSGDNSVADLLQRVEKLNIEFRRQSAKVYAQSLAGRAA